MPIISASRRTDIPAFFPEWFMNRIRASHVLRVNPFNPKQVKRISLLPEDVDAIVFWTKNPRPLMAHLSELDRRGFQYYFQFTLNPYDPLFEPHLPPLDERLTTFRELSRRFGAGRVVWRYDPVILSSVTPVEWHLERIQTMAEKLSGKTERLMFSFLDFYGKVDRRLKELERRSGIQVFDITGEEHREEMLRFAEGLKRIGDKNGIQVFSCARREDLGAVRIGLGSCIDGDLICRLFSVNRKFTRDKNQRAECRCVESVDMGMYNTCSFGCVYCYANRSYGTVRANLGRHNANGASILGGVEVENEPGSVPGRSRTQGLLK